MDDLLDNFEEVGHEVIEFLIQHFNNPQLVIGIFFIGLTSSFQFVIGLCCKLYRVLNFYLLQPIFGREIDWKREYGEWAGFEF